MGQKNRASVKIPLWLGRRPPTNSPVIVCPECGNIFEVDKNTKDTPCPHQKKFINEIKSDPRFKEW